MRAKTNNLLIEIIAALFVLLFVYTAISKLVEHRLFVNVLKQLPLLSHFSQLVSLVIPVIELLTASLLFLPASRKSGFTVSFILMIIFTCYIAYIILFESNLPCSCGGVIAKLTWLQHLIFNILFSLLAFVARHLYKKEQLLFAISRTSRTPV